LAPRLFEAASVCAAWPPTGFPEGRGFREIRAEADDDHRATDADRFGLYAADRADATMPWFRIRRTGKHFELTNAEFQNAMRNTLRLPSGRAAEVCNFKGAGWRNDVDHLNCCRCGAWSWAPRHELVLGACRRAAAAHGCQATTNFPEIYGWLIDGSATRDLSLKVLDPGNPVSVIEIKVFGCNLRLNIGDYIVKDSDNFYYVSSKKY
jgi:hypothetical protein